MADALVQVRDLVKTYQEGSKERLIFDRLSLDIFAGEYFALLGQSGSGKSTLLNLLAGIDAVTSGAITIGGTEITGLSSAALTRFRRDTIGIVFQSFNLIPTLTALENITLPLELRGGAGARAAAETRAAMLLERVGLGGREGTFPDKLSGGEQQRVAIARALVHEPAIILADEPTGNLDARAGQNVLELLLELTRDLGRTLIMATHDTDIARRADRIGRVISGGIILEAADETAVAAAAPAPGLTRR
jgi:putative ABC transport system ATP-binding protein